MERLFQLGGILLLIGAVLPIFLSQENFIYAAIVYTIGAIPFSVVQFRQHYKGQDIVIRRLRRQQVSGAILLLVTAVLMFTEYFLSASQLYLKFTPPFASHPLIRNKYR